MHTIQKLNENKKTVKHTRREGYVMNYKVFTQV